jgi:23S rRNA (adenine-N6)-dimethyltransferase
VVVRAPTARRRRRYAQHFLASNALAADLVRGAGVASGDLVVEIGAGGGRLTAELARRARAVQAIELDPTWAGRLRERFAHTANVLVLEADALALALPDEPFRVLANVPFNRTAAILRHLLDDPATPLVRADLLVEWAAACKRARVAPSTYLGVVWGARYEFGVARRLHPSAFVPPPTVDVGLLRILRRERPLVPASQNDSFRRLVHEAFTSRGELRRSLRRRLTPLQLKRLGRAHGFAPDAAPSDLDVHQWAALHHAVHAIR